MTEEEKKAIEIVKEIWQFTDYSTDKIALKVVLDLIKKLQKENEELKNKVVKRDKELIRLEEYANKNFERKDDVKAKYIPKDKIREKIKELEEYIVKIEEETCGRCITIGEDMCIRYLKELLEEE